MCSDRLLYPVDKRDGGKKETRDKKARISINSVAETDYIAT